MENKTDYIELVRQAQLGDKDCLNRLAEVVRERLYAYVYRQTLVDGLTEDIVQESILEMLKIIGELREVEQFWPWLHKIALNKIRHHYRNDKFRKTVSTSDMDADHKHDDSREVVADMVFQEFREAVIAAMRELKPDHRSIINMRCYDQMPYSEIAAVMKRSEFATQMLFYRAKKSLKKKLVRRGLGKGSLVMALVLFGKLTATSEAAVAGISVTSATIKVGTAASIAAVAASKTVIISLTTAAVITTGTIAVTIGTETGGVAKEKPAESSSLYSTVKQVQASQGSKEYWYYYPSKSADTVMMRIEEANAKGKGRYCQYLQNADGNYYFDSRKNTVCIENYRQWQKDLSVWRLPTDSFELTEFLSQIDGIKRPTEDVYHSQSGMLLVAKKADGENRDQLEITHHYNVLGEDYFKYDWPGNAKVIDNRDVMHKRGWTYFRIDGLVAGEKVSGAGRIPFVYQAAQWYPAWLRLRVGDKEFVDAGEGVLFKGLSRPWTGLHTIDTVRRDAAEKQIAFETKLRADNRKAQLILTKESGKIIYTIDLENDVVEKIVFTGQREGLLVFEYLQEIDEIESEFASPRSNYRTTKAFSILEAD